MAINDSKYTGKNTRVKLKRLMNLSTEHVVKNRSNREIGLSVDNTIKSVSGAILSNYSYRTQINVANNINIENLIVSSLKLSDSFLVDNSDGKLVIHSKTVDGFTVESSIEVEE